MKRTIYLNALKLLISFVLAVNFSGYVYSQNELDIESGDEAFNEQDYESAIDYYKYAFKVQETATASRKLAEAYKMIGLMDECEAWLIKTIEMEDSSPNDVLKYAEILKILERYPEAIEQYRVYSKLDSTDRRAQEHIRNPLYFEDLWGDSLRYRMHILGINSDTEAFGVVPYGGNNYMFSASSVNQEYCEGGKDKKKEDLYFDVYECSLDVNEQFTGAKRLGKTVNSKYHDGPIYFDKHSSTMFITRNNMNGSRPVRNSKGEIILKIYTTELIGEEWQEVKELSLNEEEYSTGHPYLSYDGKTLYFISNRPGGFGGTDIYQSKWVDDKWDEPQNLGPNVNTEGNEMFPLVTSEGIIYFASDGHAGLGGLDNFMCEPWGDKWSVAYNLGFPINTSYDDFSLLFVPGEEIGFYTSNRQGKGFGDLYFFKEIEIVQQELVGKIVFSDTLLSMIGKQIKVEYPETGKVIIVDLDEDGVFRHTVYRDEKVKLSMADEELFSTDAFVEYNAPDSFNDPSINLGTFIIKTRQEIEAENLAEKASQDLENLKGVIEDLTVNVDQLDKDKLEDLEYSIEQLEEIADDSMLDELMKLKESLEYLENLIYQEEFIVYDDTEMFVLKKEVDNLNINNVYFGFDSYVIQAKASIILDSVYFHMNKNPEWNIEIDTHTDSRGSAIYNAYLSQERANAVRKYLKRKGIADERILLRWHGENELEVTSEQTEDDYKKNRRAEFRYLVNAADRVKEHKTGYIDKKSKEKPKETSDTDE